MYASIVIDAICMLSEFDTLHDLKELNYNREIWMTIIYYIEHMKILIKK